MAAHFLQVKHCLICESVRPEPGGKASILGFFGVAPNVSILVQRLPLNIPLTFLMVCGAGDGKLHSGRATIVGPDSKETAVAPISELILPAGEPDSNGMVVVSFQALHVPNPGKHVFNLSIDNKDTYSASFAILADADRFKAAFSFQEDFTLK
ncbi:MAG TPA: hypothetical protein VIB39_11190 [Candidatus Angelobacter sp.]|jgi:hypothetical protein